MIESEDVSKKHQIRFQNSLKTENVSSMLERVLLTFSFSGRLTIVGKRARPCLIFFIRSIETVSKQHSTVIATTGRASSTDAIILKIR